MKMYVYESVKKQQIKKGGPLHGVTAKYLTTHGFPVAEREPVGFGGLKDWKPVPAEPGMVVIDVMYGYNLYHIDINGDAHALNVKVTLVEHEFPEQLDEIETDGMAGAIPVERGKT